jgi:hypothetical protein
VNAVNSIGVCQTRTSNEDGMLVTQAERGKQNRVEEALVAQG